MKEVLILEHDPKENAGTIRDYLDREHIPYREIELFHPGHRLPDPASARALVVMGGPMNVYEEERHPFLREEDAFIRGALAARVPYLGICLGSQLLAKALGARVYKAARPEIGWDDVTLAPAAKEGLFAGIKPGRLRVLQWHEDTFDLPRGAELLASSAAVPNQAFGVDGLFYGLQFHLEIDRPLIASWFEGRAEWAPLLAEYDSYRQELGTITTALYRNFFSLKPAVPARAPR